MRPSKRAVAAGCSCLAAVAAVLVVTSVDGVAASARSATPSAATAAPRLITTVVSRDVPVNGGVGEISCPKTLRGAPAWVAVGGGVLGKTGYAVDRSYPSFVEAKGRRGWAAKLVQMPPVRPLAGLPQQFLETGIANKYSPLRHRHSATLPSKLLVRGKYQDAYPRLRMYVVCAGIASGGPYRLVTSVVRRDVEVDSDVARVGCLGAVAGGVVGGTGYAIRSSYPALSKQGYLRGWSGTLQELPPFTFLGGRKEQNVKTSVGNRGNVYSHHDHQVYLPGNLLWALPYKGYSSVRMSVVCAGVAPSAGLYRLTTTVASRDVPSRGVAQIFCPKGSRAFSGGVVGKTGYAVGSSFPVVGAHNQATGWAGSLAEIPHVRPLGSEGLQGQTVLTEPGNTATAFHHRVRFVLPAPLLIGGNYKGYSSVRMWVVCASLGGGIPSPATGITKTPRLPVTTTTPAPAAPPKTTTTAPTTTATTPKPTTTTTATTEQQLPDLVVRKVALDSSTLVWNIEIRNRGDGDAPASKTGLTQPPGSSERRIDTPPIDAGDSVTVTAECPYGTIGRATVRADAQNTIDESDEDNNELESALSGVEGRCRFP